MRYLDLLLADRPIGCWPLDETGGTVARSYGPVGDGTISASGVTPAYGPGGEIRSAMAFDGNGVVTMPSFSVTNLMGTGQPQTWEVLFRHGSDLSASSTVVVPVGLSGTSNYAFAFGAASSSLTNEVVTIANSNAGSGDLTGFTGFTIPAGWHHHAIAYDGTQNGWTYFLDGVDTGTKVSSSGGCFGFSNSLNISLAESVVKYNVAGLAYLSVFNRRLSDATIARHARAAFRGNTQRRPR